MNPFAPPPREGDASKTDGKMPPNDSVASIKLIERLGASRKRGDGVKAVRIVGFSKGREAAWRDRPDSTEVWGFNDLHHDFPIDQYIFHRWFQLHDRAYLKEMWSPSYWVHLAWLKQLSATIMPVYTTELWPDVRASVRYPKEEVAALTPHGAYHAGSFDWMLAFAILQGFATVDIYGVNFSSGGEPISARPCLEYWMGVAEGRGMRVTVHGGDVGHIFHLVRSDLQYGFSWFQLVEDYRERPGEPWVKKELDD